MEGGNGSVEARPAGWEFPVRGAAVYTGVLVVLDVVLNCLLVFGVLRARHGGRIRAGHAVLLNLAAVDLAAGMTYLPALMSTLTSPAPSHCRLLCAALPALERGLVVVTVWSAALVSLERYMFIVKHHAYHNSLSARRGAAALGAVWSLGLVFGTTSVLLSSHNVSPPGAACMCHARLEFYGIFALVYSAGFISLAFILPTTLMLIFYGFVIKVAYKRTTTSGKNPFRCGKPRALAPPGDVTHTLNKNQASGVPPAGVRLYHVRAARLLCAVLLAYLTCVTPYFVCSMGLSTGHWTSDGLPHATHLITVLLLYTTAVLNPVFYGLANRRLRRTVLGVARSGCPGAVSAVRRGRTRSDSKLSVLGDSSGSSRRNSLSSEVSALSTLSRDGFVGRDVLDLYTSRDAAEAPSHTHPRANTNTYTEDKPRRGAEEFTPSPPVANRTRRASSSCESVSEDEEEEEDEEGSTESRASSPDPAPIRRPLTNSETRRSLILRQIADAAMLFAARDTDEGAEQPILTASKHTCSTHT